MTKEHRFILTLLALVALVVVAAMTIPWSGTLALSREEVRVDRQAEE